MQPEFRLYYDEQGKVLFYTGEKPEGNYIVIDKLTFAQARPDVRVIDGKLSTINPKAIISKYKPSDAGQQCTSENISIVVDENYTGSSKFWKLSIHEYR